MYSNKVNKPPEKFPGESYMTKEPLRVYVNSGLHLGQPSRIDLEHVYLIEHRSKVAGIGCVSKSSILKLLEYREEIRRENHQAMLLCLHSLAVKRVNLL
jgi:hypothetical protein